MTANTLASQTSATASAANITKGKTAWVNGVKVTGTGADNAANYNNGYNAGKKEGGASKVVIKWTLSLLPSGVSNMNHKGTTTFTKNSDGTWTISGDKNVNIYTIGGTSSANEANITINSITVS